MGNPCTFLLMKEKIQKLIFNTDSELSQNHTEKQIMPPLTTVNWLFNDKWCYLLIACLYWKISFSRQTIVWVYYILKPSLMYFLIYCGFDVETISSKFSENQTEQNITKICLN